MPPVFVFVISKHMSVRETHQGADRSMHVCGITACHWHAPHHKGLSRAEQLILYQRACAGLASDVAIQQREGNLVSSTLKSEADCPCMQASLPLSPEKGRTTWFNTSSSPHAQRKGSGTPSAHTPRPRREQSASVEAAQAEAYFSDLLSYRCAAQSCCMVLQTLFSPPSHDASRAPAWKLLSQRPASTVCCPSSKHASTLLRGLSAPRSAHRCAQGLCSNCLSLAR